jgi:hypothetical protein
LSERIIFYFKEVFKGDWEEKDLKDLFPSPHPSPQGGEGWGEGATEKRVD